MVIVPSGGTKMLRITMRGTSPVPDVQIPMSQFVEPTHATEVVRTFENYRSSEFERMRAVARERAAAVQIDVMHENHEREIGSRVKDDARIG